MNRPEDTNVERDQPERTGGDAAPPGTASDAAARRRPGRVAVSWAVARERVGWWRRRAVPRASRATKGLFGGLPGVVLWPVLAAATSAAPWVRCWIGSSGWGRLAAAVLDRVMGWRTWVVVAAAALLSVLVGPATAVGMLLAAVPTVMVAVLAVRTAFRHSTWGRVRRRFGADGWADFWELHRGLSAHAVRRIASAQRPSLAAGLPPVPGRRQAGRVTAARNRARRAVLVERLPVTECGTWLGRSTVGPWWGQPCYAAFRDTVGLIAPPQTGKTALMTHHVVDHPGAVISTSTKPEIYLMTAALRAARSASGRVEVFNPDNLGWLGSTLRWDPVRGCAEFRTASARAGLLVGAGASGGSDDARWNEWATEVLCGLLMVADLERRSMHDIARWCHAPGDNEHGAGQALALMNRYRDAIPDGVVDSLSQVLATRAQKTRDSVFFALRGAVGFMSDPTVAALCTPRCDEPAFDVEEFLADRGTLYLLGSEEQDTASAPLLAAFTGHIFATAKSLATRQAGSQRLDPPLLLSLDEAALITPVPLPQWVSDAGGRGIHIVWSVQTPSQLRDRWGDEGADTILNATNALMVYGGLKDRDDLAEVSELCGYRHELVPDPDGDGSGHAKLERVPVCPPDRVRLLPLGHALLIHRTTPATVVGIWPAERRRDIRSAPRPQPHVLTGSDASPPAQPPTRSPAPPTPSRDQPEPVGAAVPAQSPPDPYRLPAAPERGSAA